jgi:NAD(P)-dependent dehydrogenase (short-subunit alcohol dehydrogenase family)
LSSMNDTKKVAWITGGSSGIGLSSAFELAQAGFLVVLSSRTEAALRAAVDRVHEHGGLADLVVMDAMDPNQVAGAAKEILSRHGRIDVLINSAGFNVPARRWDELNVPEFDLVIAGNLNGTFYTVEAALPAMRAQGGGTIVNVASIAGKVVTLGGGVAYTVAKHGVIALTASINMAEFKNGIRACALSPGETATPIMATRGTPLAQEVLDRMLKPEDVARAVRFVVDMPKHCCVYELVLSPTWNRGWL